ncbi:MAG: hypothetical protein ACR2RD_02965 [Woeseiaceae bacterium]
MSTNSKANKVREFLDAFEEVFDRDWSYTKQMLQDDTEAQRRARAEAGIGTVPCIADDGTFINPKVGDEVNDWGNRAKLLEAYRTLRKEIP